MVKYPEGPFVAEEIKPGEGINISIIDEVYLDLSGPMGKGTAAYYGISSTLPKWGYVVKKVDEWIFVSPVNKPYYDLVIAQREQLQNQIKAHLVSIAQTFADLELLKHDYRKYKEFADYYEKLEKGKKLIKEGKKEGEELFQQANQTLKSIFIDQVDVHTDLPNQPISLRSITVRWPTIIVEFMKLKDEDITPERIVQQYNVSEAEAVVLATKQKLYLEWRDELFKNAVKSRLISIRSSLEARKKSLQEYKNFLRPLLARYKMIKDALEKPETAKSFYSSIFRPDAQAFSIDFMKIWAWKAIVPEEEFAASKEALTEISLEKAGFTKQEIAELKELQGPDFKPTTKALPVEPSVDRIVREIKSRIEKAYGVKLTALDILEAREQLISQYEKSLQGFAGEAWPLSPYFAFIEIPIGRAVIKIPAGAEIENIFIENLKGWLKTQNIILGHMLEIRAREKQLENYILSLLGEIGVEEETKTKIVKILEEEYPSFYQKPVEKQKKARTKISFRNFGFIKAKGLYESSFKDRITGYYLAKVGREFGKVKSFFLSAFEVPL